MRLITSNIILNTVAISLSVRTNRIVDLLVYFPPFYSCASFASASINATLRTSACVRVGAHVCRCVCALLSARSFACQLARKCNDVYWRRC